MSRRKFILTAIILSFAIVMANSAYGYDVTQPHVIINQIFGGNGGYVSHNFIELYNPTEETVNLEGWAVHYRSAASDTTYSDKWYKLNLSGNIPAHHSFLIRCAKDTSATIKNDLNDYDMEFTIAGGGYYFQ